jgi:hypothetical protein
MTGQTFDTAAGGFKDFKFSEGMGTYGVTRCGEDSNGYFDRAGEYFRAGVDPRNYHGRFVCTRDQDCQVHWGDCALDEEPLRFGRAATWDDDDKRRYLRSIMDSRRDIILASHDPDCAMLAALRAGQLIGKCDCRAS